MCPALDPNFTAIGRASGLVTLVKDVFKISKIMAFTAKDNCPESNRNDWSYWNEDKKKWKFEKSSLSARCDYPPLDNGSAVEKEGRMVISYQLQLKLQHVCYLYLICSEGNDYFYGYGPPRREIRRMEEKMRREMKRRRRRCRRCKCIWCSCSFRRC